MSDSSSFAAFLGRLRASIFRPIVRTASWINGNPEKAGPVLTALTSLITILVVTLGGVITYFTLYKPEIAEATQAELRAKINSLRQDSVKKEADLRRHFAQIRLTTAPLMTDEQGWCYLEVTAEIENPTGNAVKLVFDDGTPPHDHPLQVAEARISADREYQFTRVAATTTHYIDELDAKTYHLEEAALDPGESSAFPFLIRVRTGRVYLVQIALPVIEAPTPAFELTMPNSTKSAQTDRSGDSSVSTDTAAQQNSSAAEEGWRWAARTYTTACTDPSLSRTHRVQKD